MQRLSALASVDATARLECLHRLFQLTATIAILARTKHEPAHIAKRPHCQIRIGRPHDRLFQYAIAGIPARRMRLLAGRRGRGSLDLVVEQIDDVAYLKKLNFAGASAYNGVGLPRETLVSNSRLLV